MQSSTATPSYSHVNSSVPAMHTTAQAADANTVLMPQADIQATVEYYCRQVRREINSYGLEKAMERWRVVCDYHMEIEWWYLVVREVDVILYDVPGIERQRQEASRQAAQPQASVIVNVPMLNCKEVGQLALGNYGTMSKQPILVNPMTQEEKLSIVAALTQGGKVEIGQFVIENNGTMTNNQYATATTTTAGQSYSDEQIAQAIERINGKGKTIDSKQKMAAVYWYLRWAAGWPVSVSQHCKRMSQLHFEQQLDFPCEYENIRDWAKLSFMNEDARQMEKVRFSKNDETVFYQCREVVMALENALKNHPLE